jgi:hypothetical protein
MRTYRKARLGVYIVLAALACMLAASPSAAQFSSGIEGTVFDPTGAVVPGANVTVVNVATAAPRAITTNESGHFRITNLAAGSYTITVRMQGFQTQTVTDVRLEVDQIRSIPVSMRVGDVATSIEVAATAAAIDTSQSRVSAELSANTVQEMPLVGRNMYSLTALTPGITGPGAQKGGQQAVVATDNYSNEPGVGVNAAGQRQESNVFMLDGSYTSSEPAGGIVNLSPNPDTVQEVRVTATNFSADQGRNSGAMIEVFTKYGTNNLHGTLSWFHTNNVLRARVYPWEGEIPAFRRNEFSVTVGGPIRKDKTFFFGSFNPLRSSVAQNYLDTVETPQLRSYVVSNFPDSIAAYILQKAPPASEPFGNIETVADHVAANPGFFAPPDLIPGDLPAVGTTAIAQSLTRNGWQWSGRIDHIMRDGKDRFYGQVYRIGVDQLYPFTRPAFNFVEPLRTAYVKFNYTHVFSPSMLNDFGTTYMRVEGTDGGAGLEIPDIGIGGVSGFGTWAPATYIQNNYEWRDVLSWNRGNHGLRFGVEFRWGQDDALFAAVYNRPSFSFANLLDFALDQPFSQSGPLVNPVTGSYGGLSTGVRTLYSGVFVQDDWKVRRNLTINLGFRYDDFGHLGSSKPYDTPYFEFGQGGTFAERVAEGRVDFRSNKKGSLSRVRGLGPRIGFAWSPFAAGKTSLRGGYGIYYDRPPNQFWWNPSSSNPPLVASLATNVFEGGQVAYALGTPEGTGFPIPAGVEFQLDSRNGVLERDPLTGEYIQRRVSVAGVDAELRPAQVQNWLLGIQHELVRDLVLEVDYMGSVGHRLYVRTDINRFPGDLVQNLGTLTRLNPSFSTVNFSRALGNSSSHNLAVMVTKRMSQNWTVRGLYAFGKALDYHSNSGSVGGTSIIDVTDIRGQWGRSDYDLRHKLALHTMWILPDPWKQGALSKLLGAWQVGSITILQTGLPFTVYTNGAFVLARDADGNILFPLQNIGGDYNADGVRYDVPNTPSFGDELTGKTRSDYITGVFNASDFPAPPLGENGTLGRNKFSGPGFAGTDFSLIKNIRIPWFVKEGANLQVRTEIFNLFNRVNLGAVAGNLRSGNFGKSTDAFTPRTFQFGLRIVF